MSFFNLKRTSHIDGPDVADIKVTFENLCASLQSERYDQGIEPESMGTTIIDIYKWITGTSGGKGLRLPAPMNDPDDRHTVMWAEGQKVRTRSRRDSHTSHTSRRTSDGNRVPNINPAYASSRASSTTSSRYPVVRTQFMEDDVPEEGVRNFHLKDLRSSVKPQQGHYEPMRRQSTRAPQPHDDEFFNVAPIRPKPRTSVRRPVPMEEVEQIETGIMREDVRTRDPRELRNKKKSVFVEDNDQE